MGRLGGLLLKTLGLLVLATVVLAAIGTVVGIVFGLVATIVTLVVSLAVLAGLAFAAAGLFGLFSLLRSGNGEADRADDLPGLDGAFPSSGSRTADARDPEERLRDRYVAGEIDEAEYERKLELLLGSSDVEDRLGGREADAGRSVRDRLFE